MDRSLITIIAAFAGVSALAGCEANHYEVERSRLFYTRLEGRAAGCADAFLRRALRRGVAPVGLFVASGQREEGVQNRSFGFC